MTYHFTQTICFGELNDCEVEAEFTADPESGIVFLEECHLGGLKLSATQAQDIMGAAEFKRQIAMVQDWWESDGWTAAEADARAYWVEAAE